MRGGLERYFLALLAAFGIFSGIGHAAGDADATDRLIATLTGAGAPASRAAAAAELGKLDPAQGKPVKKAMPVLLEALSFDRDFSVRGHAAEALGRLGPLTPEVVPALSTALEWDTHLMVRWRSAEALERIAAQQPASAATAVPALLTALADDPAPGVRARAAQALGAIEPGGAAVIPPLVEAFNSDAHPGVRWQSAAALERLGEHYAELGKTAVLGELRVAEAALATHPNPHVRRNAQNISQSIRHLEAQDSRPMSD